MSAIAFVYTVGGTVEGLITSINNYQPADIVLICSQGTNEHGIEIKKYCREKLPDSEVKIILLDDYQSLLDSYKKAEEAFAYLKNKGYSKESLYLDLTGGTKPMGAGATLAAAPKGFSITYVGGNSRSKNGVGIVETGTEEIKKLQNPWEVLEIPDIERYFDMLIHYQWHTAKAICRQLKMRSPKNLEPIFNDLEKITTGLEKWDCFMHAEALRSWNDGKVIDDIKKRAQTAERSNILIFATHLSSSLGELKILAKSGDNINKKDIDPQVSDMLANAQRRMNSEKYDEAVLRYYRAVELCAKRRLELKFNIDNSCVNPDDLKKLSATYQDKIKRKYKSDDGHYQFALRESVGLLNELGDKVGREMQNAFNAIDQDSKKRNLWTSRNYSWLIHGNNNTTESSAEAFKSLTFEILGKGYESSVKKQLSPFQFKI